MPTTLAPHLAVVVHLLLPISNSFAQEPAPEVAKPSGLLAQANLFSMGEVAQAASDLRQAGEAFERFANTCEGMVESVAEAMATMSSEFDPFGFKTGHRVVAQQSEMLQEQREIIRALQQQEIERLRRENKELRRQLQQNR